MICFGILRIFDRKIANEQNWKSEHIGLLSRRVGNPHRGINPCQGVGCLAMMRSRCQNGTPRVRHDVAVLRRGESESLSHNVEVLCRSVATVYNKPFRIFVSQHLVFVHQ